jgi:hypothetical protein
MTRQTPLITALVLVLAIPAFAGDKNKKRHNQRAMIEKMEAVPCGAKEHGLSGLGSIFASAGITAINSDEKLCPQYMLRTDDMEYHVRPLDHKHPKLLPVGQEGEFKISKDILEMKIPDGDHKKRKYQVVGMRPIDHSETLEPANTKYDTPRKDYPDKPPADKNYANQNVPKNPDKPNSPVP